MASILTALLTTLSSFSRSSVPRNTLHSQHSSTPFTSPITTFRQLVSSRCRVILSFQDMFFIRFAGRITERYYTWVLCIHLLSYRCSYQNSEYRLQILRGGREFIRNVQQVAGRSLTTILEICRGQKVNDQWGWSCGGQMCMLWSVKPRNSRTTALDSRYLHMMILSLHTLLRYPYNFPLLSSTDSSSKFKQYFSGKSGILSLISAMPLRISRLLSFLSSSSNCVYLLWTSLFILFFTISAWMKNSQWVRIWTALVTPTLRIRQKGSRGAEKKGRVEYLALNSCTLREIQEIRLEGIPRNYNTKFSQLRQSPSSSLRKPCSCSILNCISSKLSLALMSNLQAAVQNSSKESTITYLLASMPSAVYVLTHISVSLATCTSALSIQGKTPTSLPVGIVPPNSVAIQASPLIKLFLRLSNTNSELVQNSWISCLLKNKLQMHKKIVSAKVTELRIICQSCSVQDRMVPGRTVRISRKSDTIGRQIQQKRCTGVQGRYFRISRRSRQSSTIRIIELRVVPSTSQGIGLPVQSHSPNMHIEMICSMFRTMNMITNTALQHGNKSTFQVQVLRQRVVSERCLSLMILVEKRSRNPQAKSRLMPQRIYSQIFMKQYHKQTVNPCTVSAILVIGFGLFLLLFDGDFVPLPLPISLDKFALDPLPIFGELLPDGVLDVLPLPRLLLLEVFVDLDPPLLGRERADELTGWDAVGRVTITEEAGGVQRLLLLRVQEREGVRVVVQRRRQVVQARKVLELARVQQRTGSHARPHRRGDRYVRAVRWAGLRHFLVRLRQAELPERKVAIGAIRGGRLFVRQLSFLGGDVFPVEGPGLGHPHLGGVVLGLGALEEAQLLRNEFHCAVFKQYIWLQRVCLQAAGSRLLREASFLLNPYWLTACSLASTSMIVKASSSLSPSVFFRYLQVSTFSNSRFQVLISRSLAASRLSYFHTQLFRWTFRMLLDCQPKLLQILSQRSLRRCRKDFSDSYLNVFWYRSKRVRVRGQAKQRRQLGVCRKNKTFRQSQKDISVISVRYSCRESSKTNFVLFISFKYSRKNMQKPMAPVSLFTILSKFEGDEIYCVAYSLNSNTNEYFQQFEFSLNLLKELVKSTVQQLLVFDDLKKPNSYFPTCCWIFRTEITVSPGVKQGTVMKLLQSKDELTDQ